MKHNPYAVDLEEFEYTPSPEACMGLSLSLARGIAAGTMYGRPIDSSLLQDPVFMVDAVFALLPDYTRHIAPELKALDKVFSGEPVNKDREPVAYGAFKEKYSQSSNR